MAKPKGIAIGGKPTRYALGERIRLGEGVECRVTRVSVGLDGAVQYLLTHLEDKSLASQWVPECDLGLFASDRATGRIGFGSED